MKSQLKRFLTRENIMKENGISRATFYRYHRQGILERANPESPFYSAESVERLKIYLEVKRQISA